MDPLRKAPTNGPLKTMPLVCFNCALVLAWGAAAADAYRPASEVSFTYGSWEEKNSMRWLTMRSSTLFKGRESDRAFNLSINA